MTFESMFFAIHGYPPFPWQSEAASIVASGESSFTVCVPTAAGKTALIDAALYAAANGGPRRIAFIIDRRVVVDEAYSRAQRIVDALADPVLSELAEKIGPIQIIRLRGGVFGDDDWVLYPEKTTIIISTVDQVGSRLLHRGYGVSPRMAPLHAGFVGNDSIFIIDEAHLSAPFLETVESCRRYGADIRLVKMTATPVQREGVIVDLSDKDRSNPVLLRRFKASKVVKLISEPAGEKDFVKNAVNEAERIADTARVVGIVVNRVLTARNIWQSLIKGKK